ncbi:MAG TPA: response regulator transcription factor [Terriglobia bacterium]|nr:response regulator transcription factor [Terriglobia bacterium]
MNGTLRLLLADDHEVVRRGLRTLLEMQPGWQVVAEAVTGREAVEQVRALKPHVAIVDMSMPELNGLEATRKILKLAPRTQVLILTQHESEQMVQAFLAAGAHGYLMKSDAARDLVAAVDSVRQGRPFFTSKVAQMVLEGYLVSLAASSPRNVLTPSECQIVQLLAEGNSNKQVASTLKIAVKTVETHRAHIMRKLKLRSVSDLVHYAVRNNMLEP